MHLCAELIAASMMLEPLGEVGAIFSLQLSSRRQFTKINNKKVIAENQCEKHKKSSLVNYCTIITWYKIVIDNCFCDGQSSKRNNSKSINERVTILALCTSTHVG